MSFTVNSTVGEILGARMDAKAVMEKYIGRNVSPSEIEMASPMSLQTVAGFVGMSQENLQALVNELNA